MANEDYDAQHDTRPPSAATSELTLPQERSVLLGETPEETATPKIAIDHRAKKALEAFVIDQPAHTDDQALPVLAADSLHCFRIAMFEMTGIDAVRNNVTAISKCFQYGRAFEIVRRSCNDGRAAAQDGV